ncbi:hypothetical protein WQ54_19010 [Bacillus sp. SA1-12]|uniref:DUF2521 family protein n=1 Tax=Bacillus sp. SA1-12 TaxID=1455638 RepID=UPI0006270724|nr:DUF2521 family protein [Bacillus sp. SA1-12]KKI90699.1 hypothetical protein WQ54_19010 [Bacillus sp. SA1-12]
MNDIISLKQKRHQKELKYEKKMLRELSLSEIKSGIEACFGSFAGKVKRSIIEDGCIDFAIEAFLLGAKYSRFGYYGESMQSANRRCQSEERQLIDDLFDYFTNWGKMNEKDISFDEIYFACEYFIQSWWKQGFIKGEKRYKLRLH